MFLANLVAGNVPSKDRKQMECKVVIVLSETAIQNLANRNYKNT